MFGQLKEQESIALLANNYIGHLGCHADGTTLVIPISYAFDNGEIFCHSPEGMKVSMMRKNSRVCFEVEEIDEVRGWKSVICQCDFEELTEADARAYAMRQLLNRQIPYFKSSTVMLNSTWPFHQGEQIDVAGVVFRLSIKTVTGRYEVFEAAMRGSGSG